MRLSSLRGKIVRTLDGDKLGRIHEVHCENGRVVSLMCGPGGIIERWTAKAKGRRLAWEDVRRIDHDAIVVSGNGTAIRS